MTFDAKDRKILKELLLNSRIPIARLARKVGISREVAIYRISRLKKDIIKEFYTMIDTRRLGYDRYTCFIQLKGVTAEQEKEFLNYLTRHEAVTYMGPVIGKWNVVFDILAKDNDHLKDIMDDITKNLANHLETYVLAGTLIAEEMFPTKIIGITSVQHAKKQPMLEKYKIDKTDRKILQLLSNNSRMEYTDISEKLKMTANSIKYRIKNMEKAGIIQGYTISVDYKQLGLEWYNLQLKFVSKAKLKNLISFLRSHPKVGYYYKYLGHENWDLDIGLIVKDSIELREFIIDLRKSFAETVKMFDIYVVLEELKANYPSKKLLMHA
jgi:DNA-binding Lrp family transcriptional regulator